MVQINNQSMGNFDYLSGMFFSLHRPPIESPLKSLGLANLRKEATFYYDNLAFAIE